MEASGQKRMGRGQRLFTGPGGVRDYRAHVVPDDRMVGIGTMSPEGTSELRYIWRGAIGTPPPKPRSKWVGEIGWLTPFTDVQNMRTGHQIELGTFRKAQEDKYTHRLQEPWCPAPNQNTLQDVKRPHTVASFNTSGAPPNTNNSAQTLVGYHNDNISQSPSRPVSAGSHISAFSVHSGSSVKHASYHGNNDTPPPGYHSNHSSRPTSAISVHSNDPFMLPPHQSNANSRSNSRASSNAGNPLRSSSSHCNWNRRPTSSVSIHSGDRSRPQSNYGNHTNRSISSRNTSVHPPSLYLSNTSLARNGSRMSAVGERPLSSSSIKSVPSNYKVGSGYNTPKSTRSTTPKSGYLSRHSSARSISSRRSIVPAATKIYRPSSQTSF